MATTDAVTLIEAGLAGLSEDYERQDRVHRYLTGDHDGPYLPPTSTDQYKLLAKRSITNWLPLLVKAPAQSMSVSGYRRADDEDGTGSPEWLAWQDNRMDARQHAIHQTALGYGLAYATVLPALVDGRPVIRGVSPRQMWAAYDDPASDALPLWALQVERIPDENDKKDSARGWLITDTTVYTLTLLGGGGGATIEGQRPHGVTLNGLPVCPVVRYAPDIDLEGNVLGVIEPHIPIQDRVNQTVFDLLVAQTYGSFRVLAISGMSPEVETDADGNTVYDETTGKPKVLPVRADSSRFMMAPDPATKFEALPGSPLNGFLEAIESGVRQLSAIAQIPPHYMLGSVVNLSAEALAAAEAQLTRAVHGYQDSMGESHELVLQLVSAVLGRTPDTAAQVRWADHESRSLSQTVDALGKAVQMLNVPARAMWDRIPGVTGTDVEQWTQMAEEDDSATRLADSMARAMTPEEPTDGRTDAP